MHKEIVNGKEITTNYREKPSYPISNGNTNFDCQVGFGENDREVLERLVAQGYTRVTFYEVATAVRGYHKILVKCK